MRERVGGGGKSRALSISIYIPIIQIKRDKKDFLRGIFFSKGDRDSFDSVFIKG